MTVRFAVGSSSETRKASMLVAPHVGACSSLRRATTRSCSCRRHDESPARKTMPARQGARQVAKKQLGLPRSFTRQAPCWDHQRDASAPADAAQPRGAAERREARTHATTSTQQLLRSRRDRAIGHALLQCATMPMVARLIRPLGRPLGDMLRRWRRTGTPEDIPSHFAVARSVKREPRSVQGAGLWDRKAAPGQVARAGTAPGQLVGSLKVSATRGKH